MKLADGVWLIDVGERRALNDRHDVGLLAVCSALLTRVSTKHGGLFGTFLFPEATLRLRAVELVAFE